MVGVSYAAYEILFFLSSYIYTSFSLPAAVIKRKGEFAARDGGVTDLPMNELYPTVKSFLINLPQAFIHILFRPYLWEFPGMSVMLTALELLFYQGILVLFLFFRNKKEKVVNNYNIYVFAFFFTMVIIIGYTIPNLGAIVRYRSLLWMFVLCPMVACIDWPRLAFRRTKR